jgi:hypothetical protein
MSSGLFEELWKRIEASYDEMMPDTMSAESLARYFGDHYNSDFYVEAARHYWTIEEPRVLLPEAIPFQGNGTCQKCGKGTYTGMNNVEHEGGKCDY